MKRTHFSNDHEDIKRVRKFSNQLKKKLYSLFIPHTINGCYTSPTYYIYLISMEYKDKLIRVSNHYSKDNFYNSPNVFNVIIKKEMSDEWMQNKINEIQLWIKGGANNGKDYICRNKIKSN